MDNRIEAEIGVSKFQLSPASNFIRTGDKLGFILSSNGIFQITGELHLDILENCKQTATSAINMLDVLSKKYSSTHIWHAYTQLANQGLIIKDKIESDFVHWDSISNKLDLNWFSCSEKDQPIVNIIEDLESEKTLRLYNEAMAKKRSWLPIVIKGSQPSIGPVFHKDGPCLTCLSHRLKENNSFRDWLKGNTENDFYPDYLPKNTLLNYLKKILDFSEAYSPKKTEFKDTLISLTPKNSDQKHLLIKRPECKHCGNPNLVSSTMNSSINLEKNESKTDYKFGYRTNLPIETWEKFKKHISPLTGVLDYVKPMPHLCNSISYVYSTSFSINPKESFLNWNDFRMPAFGKGRSSEAAKASAICEGFERASCRYRGDEPIICKTLQQLGEAAISPFKIQHFSEEQYSNLNSTISLGPVPKKTSTNETIDWLPAWSITYNERRYIPADTVLLNRAIKPENRIAVYESNGVSAGNTKEEAILQGLLELIERDATAIWWFNRLERPPFDIKKMQDDTWFNNTVKELESKGVELSFLDLTIDSKVPVVGVIGKFKNGWLYGFGCHFDSRLAANRALTELVQLQAVMQPVLPPKDLETLDYLTANPYAKKIELEAIEIPKTNTTNFLIEKAINNLKDIGIETIVINCTRPDINVPVVKVFAPGLRAFRPRFGSGRLFEVPVKLGFQKKENNINEMTPFWLTM